MMSYWRLRKQYTRDEEKTDTFFDGERNQERIKRTYM